MWENLQTFRCVTNAQKRSLERNPVNGNVETHAGVPVVERTPVNVNVVLKLSFVAGAFEDTWKYTPAIHSTSVRDEGKQSSP